MTIDVTLDVFLKGVDLVADTAFSALRHKMGYEHNLLALKRLESYALSIRCEDPERTVDRFRRLLSTRSTFYNRNKHHFALRCRWEGGDVADGLSTGECRRRLVTQAKAVLTPKRVPGGSGENFDSQSDTNRVILKGVPVYRTDVLVEGRDPAARNMLARRLENELETAPVVVNALGTCWQLAIRAESEAAARAQAEEIVVTVRRDRGLLLNPNYEGFRFLAVEPMDLAG